MTRKLLARLLLGTLITLACLEAPAVTNLLSASHRGGHHSGSPTPSPTSSQTASPSSSPTPGPSPTVAPAPSPSPSNNPTPTPTSVPDPISAFTSFVAVCGTRLCVNGQTFDEKGATAYGQYGNGAAEVAAARAAGLNTLEMVEFDSHYHQLAYTEDAATWNRADAFIAAASSAGVHIILNLSEYGQSLQAAGDVPTTYDWGPYLQFIATRVNTVSGVRYADDPTIAMVEIWGEIPAPNHPNPVGTTQQMTDFYARTMSEWHALAPNILVSSGGFSYLNDTNSGIDWKTIMSNPLNATCDVEVNSTDDLAISVPMVSSYCQSLGRPWFLAAWSSCYGTPRGTWDLDYWTTDAGMAAHAQAMIDTSHDTVLSAPVPAMAALGNDFWNLGPGSQLGTCDLGPQFPITFGVLIKA